MSKVSSPVKSLHRSPGYRGRGRRRGQALLIAVLLMVFAALLGATFVTVIAMNLNRTAREGSKTDARLAAQAALTQVNRQIVTSVQGEKWRPEQVSPPPAPGDADYDAYYTPFEKAQGWARTVPHVSSSDNLIAIPGESAINNGNFDHNPSDDSGLPDVRDEWAKLDYYKRNFGAHVFVKFPDPRQVSNGNSPTYLCEVSQSPEGLIDAAGNDVGGMLKITVIGRSPDSDVVFDRQVAYKGTASNGSPFAYAFYTGNYDARAGKPLMTRLATSAGGASSSTVTLNLVDNLNVEPGRQVTIWDGSVGATIMVQSVTSSRSFNGTSLSGSNIPYFAPGSSVRVTTLLMDGLSSIDASGSGTSSGTLTPARSGASDIATTHGLYAGLGLYPQEKSNLTLTGDSEVTVSGPLDPTQASQSVVNGIAINSTSAPVVSEGSSAGSHVNPVAMPQLDESSFSRYRQVTQFDSFPGAQYGYGQGIYINNSDDVERADTEDGRVPLANFQLQRLWQRKPLTKKDGSAISTPQLTPVNGLLAYKLGGGFPLSTGTLEERGVRGWISPWEFQARGTLIELKGDTIVITRDDRSDRTGYESKPDPQKAWADPSGNIQDPATGIASALGSPNVYRMTIDTVSGNRYLGADGAAVTLSGGQFNGVIFAEGNVRIRGYVGSKNVTVVSMGNIYVEGNLVRYGPDPENPNAG